MIILSVWILGALIGIAAAQKKGWSIVTGVLAGLFLGPLAFLLFFVSGVTHGDVSRKCPRCAEWIKADAVVCKHCGGEIGATPTATPPPPPAPPPPRRRNGPSPLTTFLTWLVAGLGLVTVGLLLTR